MPLKKSISVKGDGMKHYPECNERCIDDSHYLSGDGTKLPSADIKPSLSHAISEMHRGITALYLEVPEAVADGVAARFSKVLEVLAENRWHPVSQTEQPEDDKQAEKRAESVLPKCPRCSAPFDQHGHDGLFWNYFKNRVECNHCLWDSSFGPIEQALPAANGQADYVIERAINEWWAEKNRDGFGEDKIALRDLRHKIMEHLSRG